MNTKTQDSRSLKKWIILLAVLLLLSIGISIIKKMIVTDDFFYASKSFGIETQKSPADFNGNGIDDYTDILNGARKDAENHPVYDSRYIEGGWPPDNRGVCADVIWRAFKEAGYDLRAMINRDIASSLKDYPRIKTPDSNIDFRRVVNLKVFFEKYARHLTLDKTELSEWQPGDIVIFGDNKHIGIVSDKRTKDGICWIIHNGGQQKREEDYLSRTDMEITGHYRFDATSVPKDLLIPWEETK